MSYLLSPTARELVQADRELRGFPRYLNSAEGVLLTEAKALATTAAAFVESNELKADLYALAVRIESVLDSVLSTIVLSREDVETKFEELREDHTDWPEVIDADRWKRLERTRYLTDICDVVLGGGDFWMAIEYALCDEFE